MNSDYDIYLGPVPPGDLLVGYSVTEVTYVAVGTVLVLAVSAAIMAYRQRWPRTATAAWLLATGLLLGGGVLVLASDLSAADLRMAWSEGVARQGPWTLLLRMWGAALACALLATLLALLQHRGQGRNEP